MGIEFMTGAMIFALVDIIIFLILAVALASIGKKLYLNSIQEDGLPTKLNFYKELMTLGVLGLLTIFMAGSTQPKLKIEPTVNRSLIEYQAPTTDEITTPPPRSDTLDGFVPLTK
jgi:hypothetical protein